MVYGSNVHFFACRGSKAMIIICPLMAGRRSRHWYGAPHPTPLAPVDRRRPTDRRPLTRRAPNAERRRHHNQQHHRQQQQSSTMPPPHHPTLILSLHRPPYKSIMHAHFRLLGAVSDRSPMTRRTERRLALQLFQRLRRQNDSDNHGETKKVTFCKLVRWQGVEEEVGEDWALKSECLCQGVAVVCCFALWYWFFARLLIHYIIIAMSHYYLEIHKDIIRRMESYNSWKQKGGTANPHDEALLAVSREEFEGELMSL